MANEKSGESSSNTFPCGGAIRTLGDELARDDEFGAHDALAAAISRLIANEPGGKAIALEGEWGSGKTTVVRLLKRKLEETGRGRVFVFDGWAHEGDSLRRALIEEFAEWAKRQKKLGGDLLVPSEIWRQLKPQLESLQRRRTKQKSKARYRLKSWGRIMAFLLALVPVGALLAGKLKGIAFLAGLSVMTLPAALLVLAAVWVAGASVWRRSPDERQHGRAKEWQRFDDVLGIFLRQVDQKTNTTTWSTAEPTSIEFKRLFRNILKRVIVRGEVAQPAIKEKQGGECGRYEKEKVVVVLDNLDRLPAGEAMRAFAALRIFFGEVEPEEWIKRFWLLVPYDPGWLRGIPKKIGVNGWAAPVAEANLLAVPANQDVQGSTSEAPFLGKFFQARFRLPQAVLLKWREYLKNRLREALDGHSHDEELLDRIVSLFELVNKNHLPTATDARSAARYAFPTPREIKLFVNRLAVLHMQWPCEKANPLTNGERSTQLENNIERIPLVLQAGFALCEGRVDEDLSALVFPETTPTTFFRDSEQRLINVSSWERHVAAMWYGVPQVEALHMLLRPRLMNSFSVGVVHDGWNFRKEPYEEVQDSGSLGVHGFWEVVPAAAKEFIGTSDGSTLQRCANVLAVLAQWRDERQPWYGQWKIAWKAVAEDATLAILDGRAGVHHEGVSWSGENFALALKTPEATLNLAEAALDALGRMERPPRDEDYAKWAKQTVAIMEAMVAKSEPGWAQAAESFKVASSTQALIFLLGAAYESSGLKGRSLRWDDGQNDGAVIESMRKTFGEAKLQVPVSLTLLYHARAFHWLAWLRPDGPWKIAIDVFPQWIGDGRFTPSVLIPMSRGLLEILKRPRKDRAWFTAMFSQRGHFQNAMSRVQDFARVTADQGEKTNAPEALKALEDILNFLSESSGDAAS